MNLCNGCTECCKGSLPLSQIDYDRLPEHLRSTIKVASKEFIYKFGYLISKPVLYRTANKKDHELCEFLDGTQCSIYENRPEICVMFPNYNVSKYTRSICNLLNGSNSNLS
jgi:Fe-S-cluster containining protein